MSLYRRDLLSLADLTAGEITQLLTLAQHLQDHPQPQLLTGKTLGLFFRKASTRTRVSFLTAMYQLGGQTIDLNPSAVQMGRGELVSDTARVLSSYLDVLVVRTFAHSELEEFAHHSTIPVINALTDQEHPCQVLADLLTIQQYWGVLTGMKLVYLGDGNNVAYSLLLGGVLMGMEVCLSTPQGYELPPAALDLAYQLNPQAKITLEPDPRQAVAGAGVLYTDVWTSMGQEEEATARQRAFHGFTLDEALLALADPKAIVLHCLPAHRGEEITHEVLEGPQSQVWTQAANRLHAQKALLAALLVPGF
ncbi:ornithine carbamoyltransferase [Candidatus Cyanaurora vandensis]|uniref:ornithine carbamoyltransferase n=1 Tax=Candidatus Cyanaurora vandensis TaxID=2714958 RepID=UPI00257EDC9E|nr:ornithine carbamoyltransferase [Candidatus Cyanaurora vandensis]